MQALRRRTAAVLLASVLVITGTACEGEVEGGVEQEAGEQEEDD